MKHQSLFFFITFFLIINNLTNCQKKNEKDMYWILFQDKYKDGYGYLNEKGDTVIPPGKYSICFTDTFRTYAIVLNDTAFVAIDRHENILYKIFTYDNGPDYFSDGFFRIENNNKIGYADSATGKIIIKPEFDCGYPFQNGIAKVSNQCKIQSEGEHTIWESNQWYYIDKTGKKVK